MYTVTIEMLGIFRAILWWLKEREREMCLDRVQSLFTLTKLAKIVMCLYVDHSITFIMRAIILAFGSYFFSLIIFFHCQVVCDFQISHDKQNRSSIFGCYWSKWMIRVRWRINYLYSQISLHSKILNIISFCACYSHEIKYWQKDISFLVQLTHIFTQGKWNWIRYECVCAFVRSCVRAYFLVSCSIYIMSALYVFVYVVLCAKWVAKKHSDWIPRHTIPCKFI